MSQFLQKRFRNSFSNLTASTESPVHGDFFDVATSDPSCGPETIKMLRDMRTLTRLFLQNPDAMWENSTEVSQASAVYDHLISLPKLENAGAKDSKHWSYKCIRLASLVYATSIIKGVPFSQAIKYIPNHALPKEGFTDAMATALRESGANACWSSMVGSLCWVCWVTGAAVSKSSLCYRWMQIAFRRGYAVSLHPDRTVDHLAALDTLIKIQKILKDKQDGDMFASGRTSRQYSVPFPDFATAESFG